MLPADVLGTTLGGELIRKGEPEQIRLRRAEMRTVVVSYLTSTLVCTLAVAVCYRVLLLLNFSIIEAAAGALSLLFGTTFLHYTQNLMENNYIFLLTITGILFTCKWRKTGSRGSLLLGSAAIGANLLTRLTTVFDLLAVALLVWYCSAGPVVFLSIWTYLLFDANIRCHERTLGSTWNFCPGGLGCS
jgi:hypothetical protein